MPDKPEPTTYCCPDCKSLKVQVRYPAWFALNESMAVVDIDFGASPSYFCEACNEAISKVVEIERTKKGETAPNHEYRAIVYEHEGKSKAILPTNAAEDTAEHMEFMIDHYCESGYATGGHIETFVLGIGWVVFD